MKKRALPVKRLRLALSLAVCSLGAKDTFAQLAANTYQFSAISGTYTEITGGTAIAGISQDDGTSAALPIGFTFNYCGTDYTQVKVCSNGWVTFNMGVTTATWTNDLGNMGDIKPALMPLFDDLAGWGTGAAPSYAVSGTAPNRVFTIQLKNWNWRLNSGSPPNLGLQVKLYETTNLIEYIYRQETDAGNPSGATIGLADNEASVGYLVLNNSTATPTVSSTTLTTNIATRPATGQIYRFKPMPPFDMKADSVIVAEPFCSNSTQQVSVRIANLGTATITSVNVQWSVDGVLQSPVTYSAASITNFTTAPNNTAILALGDVFFPDATPRIIKVWTNQPNGNPDEVPANDTVTRAVSAALQGVVVDLEPKDTVLCQGDNFILDAGGYPGNPIYIWSTGSLDSFITVGTAGTYSVKVQNTDGCFDRDTVTVSVYPNPLLNSVAVVDNGDNSFTFNAIGAQNVTSYKWDFGDGSAPIEADGTPGQVVHLFTAPGDYTVTLTLFNNCSEVTREVVISIAGPPPTGVNELDALRKEIRIYPNPGKETITLSHNSGVRLSQVDIYTLTGQRIISVPVKSDKQQIDISALAPGIYNVMINTEKGKVTKKLEVIR